MATVQNNVLQDIDLLLTSIRSSFDISSIEGALSDSQIEDIRRGYLVMEDVRFSFRARLRMSSNRKDVSDVLEPLQKELLELLNSDFARIAHEIRYRFPRGSREGFRSNYLPRQAFNRAMSVAHAIDLLTRTIDTIPRQLPLEIEKKELEGSVERLRKILPEQKISPVRFDIVSNKIVIDPQPADLPLADTKPALSAKRELLDRGEKILRELEGSNCDPRLLETVSELQNRLSSDTDIVRLAVTNLECAAMYEAFKEELPSAVGAMLRTQTIGVSMYAAQFPEWSRFVENASSVEMDSKSISTIYNVTEDLVKKLNQNPTYSDPQVPKVIGYLNSFIADPKKATARSGLAVLRTLENFIIRIFQHGADFLDQTAHKTSKSASSATARLITAGLLAFALSSAAGISPVTVAMEGSSWLAQAAELVAKHLKDLNL